MFHPAVNARLVDAEKRIQEIIIELVSDTGMHVDAVHVDTRNFENYRTEIFLSPIKGDN